ncbi:hypothetical protein EDD85DRAFT_118336 [Armillaria nabsnona]|nr:hypothetical protein EDD85DRAFT_118336 [Armillaria nabsnona]
MPLIPHILLLGPTFPSRSTTIRGMGMENLRLYCCPVQPDIWFSSMQSAVAERCCTPLTSTLVPVPRRRHHTIQSRKTTVLDLVEQLDVSEVVAR